MGSPGPGRGLKRFLEVRRFILTEGQPMGSQGDIFYLDFCFFLQALCHGSAFPQGPFWSSKITLVESPGPPWAPQGAAWGGPGPKSDLE
jgi:hypothetical protein